MFNLTKLKKESGLSAKELKTLEAEVKRDYPNDLLMFEIHFLRALKRCMKGFSRQILRTHKV